MFRGAKIEDPSDPATHRAAPRFFPGSKKWEGRRSQGQAWLSMAS